MKTSLKLFTLTTLLAIGGLTSCGQTFDEGNQAITSPANTVAIQNALLPNIAKIYVGLDKVELQGDSIARKPSGNFQVLDKNNRLVAAAINPRKGLIDSSETAFFLTMPELFPELFGSPESDFERLKVDLKEIASYKILIESIDNSITSKGYVDISGIAKDIQQARLDILKGLGIDNLPGVISSKLQSLSMTAPDDILNDTFSLELLDYKAGGAESGGVADVRVRNGVGYPLMVYLASEAYSSASYYKPIGAPFAIVPARLPSQNAWSVTETEIKIMEDGKILTVSFAGLKKWYEAATSLWHKNDGIYNISDFKDVAVPCNATHFVLDNNRSSISDMTFAVHHLLYGAGVVVSMGDSKDFLDYLLESDKYDSLIQLYLDADKTKFYESVFEEFKRFAEKYAAEELSKIIAAKLAYTRELAVSVANLALWPGNIASYYASQKIPSSRKFIKISRSDCSSVKFAVDGKEIAGDEVTIQPNKTSIISLKGSGGVNLDNRYKIEWSFQGPFSSTNNVAIWGGEPPKVEFKPVNFGKYVFTARMNDGLSDFSKSLTINVSPPISVSFDVKHPNDGYVIDNRTGKKIDTRSAHGMDAERELDITVIPREGIELLPENIGGCGNGKYQAFSDKAVVYSVLPIGNCTLNIKFTPIPKKARSIVLSCPSAINVHEEGECTVFLTEDGINPVVTQPKLNFGTEKGDILSYKILGLSKDNKYILRIKGEAVGRTKIFSIFDDVYKEAAISVLPLPDIQTTVTSITQGEQSGEFVFVLDDKRISSGNVTWTAQMSDGSAVAFDPSATSNPVKLTLTGSGSLTLTASTVLNGVTITKTLPSIPVQAKEAPPARGPVAELVSFDVLTPTLVRESPTATPEGKMRFSIRNSGDQMFKGAVATAVKTQDGNWTIIGINDFSAGVHAGATTPAYTVSHAFSSPAGTYPVKLFYANSMPGNQSYANEGTGWLPFSAEKTISIQETFRHPILSVNVLEVLPSPVINRGDEATIRFQLKNDGYAPFKGVAALAMETKDGHWTIIEKPFNFNGQERSPIAEGGLSSPIGVLHKFSSSAGTYNIKVFTADTLPSNLTYADPGTGWTPLPQTTTLTIRDFALNVTNLRSDPLVAVKSQPFAGLFTLSNNGPVEFKGLMTVGIAKASEASSPNAYWAPLGHPTPIQTYTVASGGKVDIKVPDDQLTSDPGSYVMKVFYTTDLSRAGDSNLGTSAWTPLGGGLEFTVKDKVDPIPVTFQAELNDFDANQQDTDAFKVGDKIVYVAKVQLAATSGQPVTQLKYTMKYGMDAGGTPRFTTDLGNTRAGFIHNGQTTNTPIQSDTFSNGIRTVVLAPTFTLQPGDTAYLITEVAAPSGTATGAYTTNVELNTIGFTDKLPTTPIFATDTTSISSSQGVAALSGRDFKLFPPEVGRGGTIVASGVVKNDGSAKYVGKMYAAVKVNNSWIPIETKDVILDSGQEQEVVFNGIANFAPGTYETQLFYLDGMTWKPIGNSSLKVTTNTMSVWEGVLRSSGFTDTMQISLKNEAGSYESNGFFKLERDGYSSCFAFVRLGVKIEKTGTSTIKVTTTRLDNTQKCEFPDGSSLSSGGLGIANIYNITISGNDMIIDSSEWCDVVDNGTDCLKFTKFSKIGLSAASIFGAPSFTMREYNPATDGPLNTINQVSDRR